MRVELDVTVTSLLGTVVIQRHLGGQLAPIFTYCFLSNLTTHKASHVGSAF